MSIIDEIFQDGVEAFAAYKVSGYKGLPRAPYCEGSEEYDLWWDGFYTAEDENELADSAK